MAELEDRKPQDPTHAKHGSSRLKLAGANSSQSGFMEVVFLHHGVY